MALPAKADADTGHRRMGHMKGRSLELLNKTDDNGVSFKGGVSPCDVCAIGKSTRQAHPKTVTPGIQQPFELAYTKLLGPVTQTALGGFQYVRVHRREDQVEGNPSSQIEHRGSQVPAAFHTGGGGAARISHPAMSCGQGQRVHRRKVSELMSSNRHQVGVCCNQHAGTGGRVGASGPHTCGDNSMPAGGQRAAEVSLGRADVGCHLPCKPDTTLGA